MAISEHGKWPWRVGVRWDQRWGIPCIYTVFVYIRDDYERRNFCYRLYRSPCWFQYRWKWRFIRWFRCSIYRWSVYCWSVCRF
jgi:hypothetical protein